MPDRRHQQLADIDLIAAVWNRVGGHQRLQAGTQKVGVRGLRKNAMHRRTQDGLRALCLKCPDTLANGAAAGNNVINDDGFPAVIRRDIRQGDFNAPVTQTLLGANDIRMVTGLRDT